MQMILDRKGKGIAAAVDHDHDVVKFDVDLNLPPPGFPSPPPGFPAPLPPPPGFPARPPTTDDSSRYETVPKFGQHQQLVKVKGEIQDQPFHDNLSLPSNPNPKQTQPLTNLITSQDNNFPQLSFKPDPDTSSTSVTDLAAARKILSRLLPLNFQLLIDEEKIYQIVTLSFKLLKTDPTLNPYEIFMLELIQDLPSACKTAAEVKRLADEINGFLRALQENMATASLLKGQHEECKRKVARLQAEVNASVESVTRLDAMTERNATTRDQRRKLVSVGTTKMKELLELRSCRHQLAGDFARICREIREADFKRRVFEVRKTWLKDQCIEILLKFLPLRHFTI